MLEELKEKVFKANMELPERGLVIYTWGNVSGIDREKGLIVIKPSGVPYESMTVDDMVVVDMDGKRIEGKWNPSVDTPSHIVLYKAFSEVGGIVHTHSPWATAWAQAERSIPAYGTTHADYFYGEIPCCRVMTEEEVVGEPGHYEEEQGNVIVETFRGRDPMHCPGCVCAHHGPFAWGKDPAGAVYNAGVLEEVAKMAVRTEMINPHAQPAPQYMLDKHFLRKHGKNAYYGQK